MKTEWSDAERAILARMLEVAADEFSNHGCNDMDSSCFDGLSNLDVLERHFNEWDRGVNPDGWEHTKLLNIFDWQWMYYFADKVKAK